MRCEFCCCCFVFVRGFTFTIIERCRVSAIWADRSASHLDSRYNNTRLTKMTSTLELNTFPSKFEYSFSQSSEYNV